MDRCIDSFLFQGQCPLDDRLDKRGDRLIDKLMNRWMDGWMDGWMDRWIDISIFFCSKVKVLWMTVLTRGDRLTDR